MASRSAAEVAAGFSITGLLDGAARTRERSPVAEIPVADIADHPANVAYSMDEYSIRRLAAVPARRAGKPRHDRGHPRLQHGLGPRRRRNNASQEERRATEHRGTHGRLLRALVLGAATRGRNQLGGRARYRRRRLRGGPRSKLNETAPSSGFLQGRANALGLSFSLAGCTA